MKPLRYAAADFVAYGLLAAFLAGCIVFRVTGL